MATKKPICKDKKKHTAQVYQGETEFITLHDADGDRTVLNVDAEIYRGLKHFTEYSRIASHMNEVLQEAQKRLTRDFGDRISQVATTLTMHDGEVVIKVKPSLGKFDAKLATELNDLAWELEDTLCEVTGEDHPEIIIGFRQEFPGVEPD